MEKGTSLRKDGGDVTQGGDTGQAGLPALPAPPPEQRGPQALVEARDSSAPQQVPGQLGGRGSRGGWRFHRGLGSPLGREPSMGSQDLFLGGWGERDSLLARPQHRRGVGSGRPGPGPRPHRCGLRPGAGSSASPWGWSQSPGRCPRRSPPASPSTTSASAWTGEGGAAGGERLWGCRTPSLRHPSSFSSNRHRAGQTDGSRAGPGQGRGPFYFLMIFILSTTVGVARAILEQREMELGVQGLRGTTSLPVPPWSDRRDWSTSLKPQPTRGSRQRWGPGPWVRAPLT